MEAEATSDATVDVGSAQPDVLDFVELVCDDGTVWENEAGQTLVCMGEPDDTTTGFVLAFMSEALSDGNNGDGVVDGPGLLLHPPLAANSNIHGSYGVPWTIEPGDRFEATIGCREGAIGCAATAGVQLNVDALFDNSPQWNVSHDTGPQEVVWEIGTHAGETAYFTLRVLALNDGGGVDDVLWIRPRLVRAR
jgi:hypothetical protein